MCAVPGKRVTDYVPGDAPIPVGALVYYSGSMRNGIYEVARHYTPESHPEIGPLAREHEEIVADLADAYPDGVAYGLWPFGVPREPGNGNLMVRYARRVSLRLLQDPVPMRKS